MNNATQVDSRHTIQQQHKDEMCHNPRLQSLHYPLLLTTPANMETSIVVILAILGLGEAKITKTMDQWMCDYCAMGNYHHQGRYMYDIMCQDPRRIPPSAGPRCCASSSCCWAASCSSLPTPPCANIDR